MDSYPDTCAVDNKFVMLKQLATLFVATEEMYKVSSMNSHQGHMNFITNANLSCMITAVNTFNTVFCDTLTLELSNDRDNLHNHLIAQECIKLNPPLHTISLLSAKSS